MRDLQSSWAMWAKAILFVVIGISSSALILSELPTLRIFALLCLAIWSFCRAYYFAFYVLEHYIDPSFRYAGLFSLVRHVMTQKVPVKESK